MGARYDVALARVAFPYSIGVKSRRGALRASASRLRSGERATPTAYYFYSSAGVVGQKSSIFSCELLGSYGDNGYRRTRGMTRCHTSVNTSPPAPHPRRPRTRRRASRRRIHAASEFARGHGRAPPRSWPWPCSPSPRRRRSGLPPHLGRRSVLLAALRVMP